MGYALANIDIDGDFRSFWAITGGWTPLILLAYEFGWEPMGTAFCFDYNGDGENLDEKAAAWGGRYDGNEGQMVLKEDAINMSKALRFALEHMADCCAIDAESLHPACSSVLAGQIPRPALQLFDSDMHNEHRRNGHDIWEMPLALERIKELIEFCEQGCFCIF